MGTSTVPAVIDALLQKFSELAYTYEGAPLTVEVFDSYPGPNQPAVLIAVGGAVVPTDEGDQKWAGLGATARDEDYEVVCYISAATGGASDTGVDPTSQTSVSDAQRTVRQQAFSVLATIETALRADITLSQVATPPVGVLWCEISKIALEQTDAETAVVGRIATVTFHVHIRARI
jgi:hypothetical protein